MCEPLSHFLISRLLGKQGSSQCGQLDLSGYKMLIKFVANLCRKVEVCRSTKVGRHFEISLKLCALLALEVCAKGAQHHNKQRLVQQLFVFLALHNLVVILLDLSMLAQVVMHLLLILSCVL